MKDTLETLRDVLLVFTVVLLVYVLYKRLLRILGKDDNQKKYPMIGEVTRWTDARHALVEITLSEPAHMHVAVYDNGGNKVLDVSEGDYEVGKHELGIDCSSLMAGRYYYTITSPVSQSSQYFDLK